VLPTTFSGQCRSRGGGGIAAVLCPGRRPGRSATVCHLANICRELGRKLHFDPQKEVFPGDDEANALLDRPRRKGFELPEIT